MRRDRKKEKMEAGGAEGRCFPSCLFFIRVFKSNERLRGRRKQNRPRQKTYRDIIANIQKVKEIQKNGHNRQKRRIKNKENKRDNMH